ncbi:MAG: translation elongation factor Ts [Candidatus Roizmanbacteria bacterium]|nr:translation elongation factor Ts [Candidatus Roizmanbacteria bacterium]
MSTIELIKKLRVETGASVALCNKALLESKNDLKRAHELLKTWGVERAQKKQGTEAADGVIESYIHHNKRMGALLTLHCQTDFVAKNEEFRKLAREIAMQIASMAPKTSEELLKQAYIRDSKKTIESLIQEQIAKLGENIKIGEFVRFEI